MMIARFSVILSSILVCAAWAKQPNVLILYADDLGFGDLGCYNKESRIPTPNLDRLASESVRFTDGHSSSGICTPSRFAMLTGRHHWRDFHGIVNAFGDSVFKPERLTLPEMLKEKGYKTAAIGKWHLGWNWDAIRNKEVRATTVQDGRRKKQQLGPEAFDWTKSIPNGPLDHGFDYYFGDTVINFPPYCWIENDKVVKAPDTLMQTGKWKKIKEGGWECRPGPMVTGWDPYQNIPTTTKKGVKYIKEAANAEEPFFLYFAYPAPHAPIIPNDEFDGKSKAGPYGDFVHETDHSIGQLLQALKDSGQAENTLVIFSADNGPEHYAYARDVKFDHWSAHPFRGLKRDAYEGGHHVPFMIKYPGVTMAGTVNDALVSQIDIMATLASVVGYDLPEKNAAEDSHDLLPLLKGEAKSIRTSHVHNTFDHTWAFREGDWVLITGKSGHHSRVTKEWLKKHDYPKTESKQARLFNLREDIGQRNDLAAKYPEKVRSMKASLAQIREQGYSAPRLRK